MLIRERGTGLHRPLSDIEIIGRFPINRCGPVAVAGDDLALDFHFRADGDDIRDLLRDRLGVLDRQGDSSVGALAHAAAAGAAG